MSRFSESVVSVFFVRFNHHRFWAFTQMQRAHKSLKHTKDLEFYKLLGTGGGKGFSLWPDFSTYAFLGIWTSDETRKEFINKNSWFLDYTNKATLYKRYDLLPIKSHGLWNGKNPFHKLEQSPSNAGCKVAVITRATLQPWRLLEFWRAVPVASKGIQNAKHVQWFKGIGEWPFIEQATFSVWENEEALQQFAYKSDPHKKIVKKTFKRKWYKESLFSRFSVENIETYKSSSL